MESLLRMLNLKGWTTNMVMELFPPNVTPWSVENEGTLMTEETTLLKQDSGPSLKL